jgi:hypothetical protein
VNAGLTLEPGQVRGDGKPQRRIIELVVGREELCCVQLTSPAPANPFSHHGTAA